MSTEFKKGDRVLVKPGATSTFGWAPRPEDAATPLIVQRVEHDHRVYVLSGGPDYGFRPEGLTHADAVHAALDPKNVKAGDTVTLVSPASVNRGTVSVPAKIEGVVREVLPDGRIAVHGVQGFFFPSTLTAHQPAPEPEPERVSGEVAIVKFDDMSGQHRAVYKRGEYRGGIWELLAGGHDAYADETTVVRPLVVIDPAEVDVEALTQVARKVGDKSIMAFADSTAENIVRAVLAASGIEVPR